MVPTRNRAVIWDMDGVIVDSYAQHFKAWQAVFRQRGVDFTDEDFRRTFGQRNDTIIRDMLGDRILPDEIEPLNQEKQEMYRRTAKQDLRAFPGAIELIKALKANRFKLALASSGPARNITMVLHGLHIEDYFDAVVSGEDVTEGKPSPQCFLLAAQKLGIASEDCVVIEDAVAGVAAAKNGGMRCIAVTNTHPQEKLRKADLVVDSLEKVTIQVMESLLASKNKSIS